MIPAKRSSTRPGGPTREPLTARSKLEAERFLLGSGAPVHILRPCMMHGPGNRGNLNLLCRWITSGMPYPLAGFRNSRSFLSIENFNHIVAGLCEGDAPPGVYNLADTGRLSTLDLVNLINAAAGKTGRNWSVPPALILGAARAAKIAGLPFVEERLRKLTGSFRVDNGKILRALGGDLPLSAEAGMRGTLESFLRRSP